MKSTYFKLITGFGFIILSLVTGCENTKHEKQSADIVEMRVDSLINIMTIDEKIGQMVLFTSNWEITGPVLSSDYRNLVRQGLCGNIFNAHTSEYNRSLQEIAVNETRLGIPLLFGFDVVHGYKTIFPISLGEAASWDMDLIEKASRVSADEATAAGLNWTFAPMVDIARDPRWGRISESGGEDPYLGSIIARARVRGFQGDDLSLPNTILACVKHFAAYGAAEAGRDYNTVDMSERILREVYLPPFIAAIDEGVGSVMTSFNEYDGVPVTGNRFLLKEILRDEWGFEGLVVTDYTSINELIPHGYASDSLDAARLAFKAGVDMDMQGSVYLENLKDLYDKGVISDAEINRSVKNVLTAKFKLGLFDDPYLYFDSEREESIIRSDENMEIARELAQASIVLLKNQNRILPINPGKTISVIGPLADSKIDLLGSWKAAGNIEGMSSLLDQVKQSNSGGIVYYSRGCGFSDIKENQYDQAINVARKSDVIVLAVGEPWNWSGEAASRTSIELPETQKELLRRLSGLGKPLVLVLFNGRPLALKEEYTLCEGMIEAWYPGSMGAEAVADVLFGRYNPSGKLPVTFPENIGQVPIYHSVKNTGRPYDPEGKEQKYRSRYIDSSNDPLFPFGYGLSYSDFIYSNLVLNKRIMVPGDTIIASVEILNSSEYDGKEIVQLYLQDLVGSVTRPVRELKGFKRVNLEKGEKIRVEFTICEEDLKFYRHDMSYGSEPGEYRVFIGGNSRDCQVSSFNLQ